MPLTRGALSMSLSQSNQQHHVIRGAIDAIKISEHHLLCCHGGCCEHCSIMGRVIYASHHAMESTNNAVAMGGAIKAVAPWGDNLMPLHKGGAVDAFTPCGETLMPLPKSNPSHCTMGNNVDVATKGKVNSFATEGCSEHHHIMESVVKAIATGNLGLQLLLLLTAKMGVNYMLPRVNLVNTIYL